MFVFKKFYNSAKIILLDHGQDFYRLWNKN